MNTNPTQAAKIVFYLFLLVTWLTGCQTGISTADKISGKSFFDHIQNDEIIDLHLTFDWKDLMKVREEEKYVPAEVLVVSKEYLQFEAKISSRGITRKKYCPFPPLRLNIKDNDLEDWGFSDVDKYKIVTHCSDSIQENDQVLREYLVYQLYSLLDTINLRTQLCRIHYHLGKDTLTRYGFILESEKELGWRMGGEAFEVEDHKINTVNLPHYKQFAMFQYMIGNTDWNLGKGHNTFYFHENPNDPPIIVPYDFDYAGLVNAYYARPHPNLKLKNVRERLFQYQGSKEDDFTDVKNKFIARKQVILDTIDSFSLLPVKSRKDMHDYLISFFELIENNTWQPS